MEIPKISTNFRKDTDADFEVLSAHILEKMTDNAFFPNPNPTLAVLQVSQDKYSKALRAAKELGKDAVAEKRQCRLDLEAGLAILGSYVTNAAAGNRVALVSSGFPVLKDRQPRYIVQPGMVSLSNGKTSGDMVSAVKTVVGADGYAHEITDEQPGEKTVWRTFPVTTSKFTFTDLVPGKQYWVRVAVIGSKGQKAYSPVSSRFAQ